MKSHVGERLKDPNNNENCNIAKTRSSATNDSALAKYSWTPQCGDVRLIECYMQQLPPNERPLLDTDAVQLRRQRLVTQLPLHDCELEAIKSLKTDYEMEAFGKFIGDVKEKVVGIGEIVTSVDTSWRKSATDPLHPACKACQRSVEPDEVGIVTEHGRGDIWHPSCFRCVSCNQLLVDLIYFHYNGGYYCGRHFGEKLYPRCSGCDELIFAKEYTYAEEKAWHIEHFCCFGCDLHLGGHKYVTKEEKPFCIECYMNRFAKECATCKQKIGPFVSRVSHKDLHWHETACCFKCKVCERPLLGLKFLLKGEDVLCSAECKEKLKSATPEEF